MFGFSRRRGPLAIVVAFALFASTSLPARADTGRATTIDELTQLMVSACDRTPDKDDQARVAAALQREQVDDGQRVIAQSAFGQDTPSPAPSPSTSGSPQPPPPNPNGGILAPPTPSGSGQTLTPPPLPTPTVRASASAGPILLVPPSGAPTITPVGQTPSPGASEGGVVRQAGPSNGAPANGASPQPSASATAIPTLGPNQVAVYADHITGSTANGKPGDADGNVNIFYSEGVIHGDHAHFDGVRYADVTGHAYIKNNTNDSILYGDKIRFDQQEQKAYLTNGRGISTQGVERGLLHYTARDLQTDRYGRAHGDRGSLTTCENPRGGYHIESRTVDVTPGDKMVLRKNVLFLGALAIFYLPIVIISLRQDAAGRRQSSFVPLVGYSQQEGYWIKTRLAFAPSSYYYGQYIIEYYTKLGPTLGYNAFFVRKNLRRNTQVNAVRTSDRRYQQVKWNGFVDHTEYFSSRTTGKLRAEYQSNYGPLVQLPPTYTYNTSLTHVGGRSTQNYTLQRYNQGGQQSSSNYGFVDNLTFRPGFTQGFNVSYSTSSNSLAGAGAVVATGHFNSQTNLTTPGIDYNLNFDRTESKTPSGLQKLPELIVRPHGFFTHQRVLPLSGQFTFGEYEEPSTPQNASRGELAFNLGPSLLKFFGSDLSLGATARQVAYSTGDLQGQITQTASLITNVNRHIQNSIQYNEQNSNGPQAVPFRNFVVAGASHSAQEVFRFYNRDVYSLSLQTGTSFNRQGQPISYSFTSRPSYRSSLNISGSYVPGPGNGFFNSNVQFVTPFGRGTDIQGSFFVDWKNKGRITNKVLYYRKIIGDCYDVRVSYDQNLKQVNLGIDILAFPSRSANFGLGRQGSIIPQSFSF